MKSSFKKNTMEFQLISPSGYRQRVMALKMTCGNTELFPGFIDVRMRRAGELADYHKLRIAHVAPDPPKDPEEVEGEVSGIL